MHFVAFVEPLPAIRHPAIDHEKARGRHQSVMGPEQLTGRSSPTHEASWARRTTPETRGAREGLGHGPTLSLSRKGVGGSPQQLPVAVEGLHARGQWQPVLALRDGEPLGSEVRGSLGHLQEACLRSDRPGTA